MGETEPILRQGLRTLRLSLSDKQICQLLEYQALIEKWNRIYNLTALRNPGDMLTHHLLDSLAAINPLRHHLQHSKRERQHGRILDVGSGAGLPGVVIAICCPEVAVSCVDAVAKKASFIQQAALALKLPNLVGLHARVETLTQSFDLICSRAFASLVDFTQWSTHALEAEGVWMAMKGKQPANEIAALPPDIAVFHVEQLQVPGLDAERCLVWLRRNSSVNKSN